MRQVQTGGRQRCSACRLPSHERWSGTCLQEGEHCLSTECVQMLTYTRCLAQAAGCAYSAFAASLSGHLHAALAPPLPHFAPPRFSRPVLSPLLASLARPRHSSAMTHHLRPSPVMAAAAALLLLLALCTFGPAAAGRAALARPPDPPSSCDPCRKVTGDGVVSAAAAAACRCRCGAAHCSSNRTLERSLPMRSA